jgi:Cdc6-like AAA superfamily ATPase
MSRLPVCRRSVDRAVAASASASASAVRVTMAHVAAVVVEVFGSPYVQKIRGLPVHGKLALCTLLLLLQTRRTRDLDLGDVQAVYLALCKHRGLVGAVSRSEFHDLCSALESGPCFLSFFGLVLQEGPAWG